MRNLWIAVLSVGMLAGSLPAQTSQPSLGEVARQQRQAKKSTAKHVITNEDIAGSTAPLNTATATEPGEAQSPAKAADEKSAKKQSDESAEAAQKTPTDEQYRAAVQKQRAEIAKLEKQIADADHKVRVQSTNYYTDAGSRLRDSKAWVEQRTKIEKENTDAQKKLDEAKAKLEDLLEQARKLGIPASSLE